MIEKKINLYIADLKNNCPVCYTDNGMQLSFFQIEKETRYFLKSDKEIQGSIFCSNCNQSIYPIQYTKDMELVYDYHSKKVEAIKPKYKFKTPVFIFLGIGVFSIISVFLLLTFLL